MALPLELLQFAFPTLGGTESCEAREQLERRGAALAERALELFTAQAWIRHAR